MPEQVAVVNTRAAAQLAHRVAKAGLDQRVDHDCGTATRLLHCDVEILGVLDPRVPDFLERLIRELRLGASTSRCAVSPVESETMWSSTG